MLSNRPAEFADELLTRQLADVGHHRTEIQNAGGRLRRMQANAVRNHIREPGDGHQSDADAKRGDQPPLPRCVRIAGDAPPKPRHAISTLKSRKAIRIATDHDSIRLK